MPGMSSFKGIPIETGTKYRTPEGVVAVRNGDCLYGKPELRVSQITASRAREWGQQFQPGQTR